LIFEDPEHPSWRHSLGPTEDGKYLILRTYRNSEGMNKLAYVETKGITFNNKL